MTGPVVENEYGNVQVQITLSGSRIVNAVALELPEETAQSDQRSEDVDGRYSGTSGQVVQRQSADLDTVSGATATSNSYRQSLQAAIDRA
ncbi:FMN-binding protein [Micromonospora phytophila]|uniref:FMN-binding protein n=1 Tax=Micromonospora phytophila TaxID=709888 RepID=UPI00202E542C|nr:FMN-binding protein [Micromonospora phytophila]MCM0679215.1 FMN-binding protein [Micromonospora phytophila]